MLSVLVRQIIIFFCRWFCLVQHASGSEARYRGRPLRLHVRRQKRERPIDGRTGTTNRRGDRRNQLPAGSEWLGHQGLRVGRVEERQYERQTSRTGLQVRQSSKLHLCAYTRQQYVQQRSPSVQDG